MEQNLYLYIILKIINSYVSTYVINRYVVKRNWDVEAQLHEFLCSAPGAGEYMASRLFVLSRGRKELLLPIG